MNILLVYPQMPDTFYAMKHFIKVVGKKSGIPTLGSAHYCFLIAGEMV